MRKGAENCYALIGLKFPWGNHCFSSSSSESLQRSTAQSHPASVFELLELHTTQHAYCRSSENGWDLFTNTCSYTEQTNRELWHCSTFPSGGVNDKFKISVLSIFGVVWKFPILGLFNFLVGSSKCCCRHYGTCNVPVDASECVNKCAASRLLRRTAIFRRSELPQGYWVVSI